MIFAEVETFEDVDGFKAAPRPEASPTFDEVVGTNIGAELEVMIGGSDVVLVLAGGEDTNVLESNVEELPEDGTMLLLVSCKVELEETMLLDGMNGCELMEVLDNATWLVVLAWLVALF